MFKNSSDPPETPDVRTYETNPGEWVVADNAGWRPGIYDTEATALHSTQYTTQHIENLWTNLTRSLRVLTMDDLTPPQWGKP